MLFVIDFVEKMGFNHNLMVESVNVCVVSLFDSYTSNQLLLCTVDSSYYIN